MRPAAQHHDRRAAQVADEQLPAWPLTPVGGKPGSLRVGNLRVHPQLAQDVVKAAAQHHRQRRPEPRQLLQPRRRGLGDQVVVCSFLLYRCNRIDLASL